ncbi:MAG: T9SS type A sorting domain-containing protein [Bacteroidetes bacterium]|nr:T9SS type A sorting domain-containing protein [Bacteroidota bacterium]
MNAYIAVSYDNGENWTDMSEYIPEQISSSISAIHFITKDFGLFSAFNNASNFEVFFYTENGGQDWQPANIDLQNSEPNSFFAAAEFKFKDDIEGWAIRPSSPATVLHTTDGGRNWEILLQDNNEIYRHIAYQNGDTLILNNWEHLMYSYDGGESWEDIEDNLWQERYSAFFLNRQRGWWAGRENQVHSTYDGGVTWDTSYVATGVFSDISRAYQTHFVNDSLGWAIVYFPIPHEGVYVSTDGGDTWAKQNPHIDNPLRIKVYGDSLAYILTIRPQDEIGKVYRYRKRKASCLPAGSVSISDSSSLYPLLSWQPATGAYDGYYLQLGSTPGGQDVLPRTDVGLDTFYQAITPLPDGVELYATVLPYNHILGAAEDCGSTAFTTPVCPPPIAVDTGYCKGSSLLWLDSLITSPGAYTFADTLSSGCVQETQLQVQQYDNPSTNIDTAYCAGTSFYWQDSLLAGPGTYQFGYTSAQGCDSTLLLHLEEWPAPTLRIDTSICEGGSYAGQDTLISDAGTYSFHYSTALGCDSTVQLFLEERPNSSTEIDTALIAGELYDGQAYEGDTTLVYNLTAANGCDSIVTVYIDIVTSTYQPQQAQTLRVLPNPSNGDFTILALPQATAPARLQVLDSSGKRILDQEADLSSDWQLPAQGWPAGLYLLRAEVDGELYTARLIKQ